MGKTRIVAIATCAMLTFSVMAADTFEYGDYDDAKKTCSLTAYNGTPSSEVFQIPNNHKKGDITYQVIRVNRGVLNNLKGVKTIKIGPNLKVIGGSAQASGLISLRGVDNFFGCSDLVNYEVSKDNGHFANTGAGMLVSKDGTTIYRVPARMAVSGNALSIGDAVTHIAPRAFSGNATIKTIKIGKNVRYIYYGGGLYEMPNLESYTVSAGNTNYFVTKDGILVRKLSSGTSANIVSTPRKTTLTSYSIPTVLKPADGNNISIVGIEDFAFANLTNLKSISIGSNVSTIDDGAFINTGITSIIIPETVEDMGESILAGNGSLTEIRLRGTEVYIPANFARDCRNLTTVSMDEVPAVVDHAAFKNCTSLTSFPFGGGTELRGDSIFANTGFTDIKFRGGLYSYYSDNVGLFTGCRNLQSIDMSSISLDAGDSFVCAKGFATNCPKLNTLIFPMNVNLREQSFGYNNALKTIILNNFVAAQGGVFGFDKDASPRAYVFSRKTYPQCETETGNLFRTNNGAKLTPRIYMDAFTPLPEGEPGDDYNPMPTATYYVPGGTLAEYRGYPNLTEMYTVVVTNESGKAKFQFKPTWSGVVMNTVNYGDGSVDIPADGIVNTNVNFNDLGNVNVSYTVNDVTMLTKYPYGYLTNPLPSSVDMNEVAGKLSFDIKDRILTISSNGEPSYALTDINGACLLQGHGTNVALTDINSGIYILTITDNNSRLTTKIVLK